jgi:hypothetical protein
MLRASSITDNGRGPRASRVTRFFEGILRALGIRKGQPVAIADAVEGTLVRLSGLARRGSGAITAPLTGDPCVAFQLHVERLERQQRNNENWLPLVSDEGRVDFFLEDDTGRARILGAKIEIATGFFGDWQQGAANQPLQDLIARQGESHAQTLRWRELVIRDGDPLEVVGLAKRGEVTGQNGAGYRGTRQELVVDAPDIGWIQVRRTSQ